MFHLGDDPQELVKLSGKHPDIMASLRKVAAAEVARHPALELSMSGGDLQSYPFAARPFTRIRQFNLALGVSDFEVN